MKTDFAKLESHPPRDQEQTVLERQIAATDTQIDRLVYHLYGLTVEEIQIVAAESKTRRRRRQESLTLCF